MGKRLSKIVTRTGDKGSTGLGDGKRIPKDHPRIQAIGSVDELNSFIGMLIADLQSADLQNSAVSLVQIVDFLQQCQHRIFDLGGELSIPGYRIIAADDVVNIELALDKLNSELAPLENFILPGGSQLIAMFHICRSVCRRAERDLISLQRDILDDKANNAESLNADAVNLEIESPDIVSPETIKFLNRLSDYLFVAARYSAKTLNIDEVLWQKK